MSGTTFCLEGGGCDRLGIGTFCIEYDAYRPPYRCVEDFTCQSISHNALQVSIVQMAEHLKVDHDTGTKWSVTHVIYSKCTYHNYAPLSLRFYLLVARTTHLLAGYMNCFRFELVGHGSTTLGPEA